MKPKVILLHCPSYELPHVEEALVRGLELLGGVTSLFKEKERILLKPNLLYGQTPEKCVTTHPSIFEGITKILKARGLALSYGDSPGYGKPLGAAKKAGIAGVAERYNLPLADFESSQTRQVQVGKSPVEVPLATGALEVDGIVSLPKMKTHGLTLITGAVKNQFGCVPGFHKAEFHVRFPNLDSFATLLLQINLLLKPRLYIMDGVLAMDGEGPGSGDPYPMECILMSTDAVALDATFCRLVNLDPRIVPTIQAAQRLGLGTWREEEIEVLGEPLERFRKTDFRVKREPPLQDATFRQLRPLKNLFLPQPRIDSQLCKRCGICVEACPVSGKALSFRKGKEDPPLYNYSVCIRCFCCHEMCPHRAIFIHTPWLGKKILTFLGGRKSAPG